ncbi:MAG: hypothetical protein ACYC96_14535 [Fimbriimonadaceae bacterium]
MTVGEIVAEVTGRLEVLGIPYVVGGSLASSAWGQMRQTNDADIAILLASSQVEALVHAFGDPFSISRDELAEAFRGTADFRSAQLMHMDEAFKIDLFLLHAGEYEKSELTRGRPVGVGPGATARFAAPENVILAKLRCFVLGNQVSDRQWNDIVAVLEVQAGKLDEPYLDRWAKHFGVADLLANARCQTA